VVPATPNGMPTAMTMMSPGPAGAFIPDLFAGVLYDFRDSIRFPDRHRMDAPHQAKAAWRLLILSECAENTGYD
jgi:hypothetical protein